MAPQWPHDKRFAFTVFDDTDFTTLDNGPLIYDFLTSLGFRITKSVWPAAAIRPRTTDGLTCADPAYLEWVLSLQAQGHEIGYHNATDHPSLRDETIAALDRFKDLFGAYPRIGADHAGNCESLYWGPRRLTGIRAAAYGLAQRIAQPRRPEFSGHDPESPYFWGDICQERIRYWRNFTFAETNVLRAVPEMPYHDADRPFVNRYFSSTHAPRLRPFVDRLTDERVDRLEREGGVCIMYTHFGVEFVEDGKLHPDFVDAMTRLSRRNGWFAPASEVLDHLDAQRPAVPIGSWARRRIETRWIVDRTWHARRIGPRMIDG